jgi:hypothetical protein
MTGSSLPCAAIWVKSRPYFGVLGGHALAAPDFLQGAHEAVLTEAEFLEDLFVRRGEQDVFDRDVGVFQALGFGFRSGEDLLQASGNVDLVHCSRRARDLGELFQLGVEALVEGLKVDICFQEDRLGEAALLLNQGKQEMLDVELLMAALTGHGLGGAKAFLEFFGKAVEVHRLPLEWSLSHE